MLSKKEVFNVKINKSLVRDFEAIQKNIKTQTEQVIDARGAAEFNKPDPVDAKLANNIANSKNVPFGDLFDNEHGTMKDKQLLLESITLSFAFVWLYMNGSESALILNFLFKVFKKQNVDMNKPIVASCMTGMSASSLALAANVMGLQKVAVYAVINICIHVSLK